MPQSVILEQTATADNFEDDAYLEANPDVVPLIESGQYTSARNHFDKLGRHERRRLRTGETHKELQTQKLERLDSLLNKDLPHTVIDGKYDFLTPGLRDELSIVETDNVSSHDYPKDMQEAADEFEDGLVLDFGAGKRPIYFSHIVNYDIVRYDTTDVIGVGEVLPFKDNSFDAVVSNAVLEHVKDPWRCASEIARILKPGGKLWCAVAFNAPLHGYPNHYFNMTAAGVRTIFEPHLVVDDQTVPNEMLPIYTLQWYAYLWYLGLDEERKKTFLDLKFKDLMRPIEELKQADWAQLPSEKIFELATCTAIIAHKA